MSDSALLGHQLDTIHRQAKRFSARLDLPITASKAILAKAFYRCADWSDLEGRLKSLDPDEHVQLLAALPQSAKARSYFDENCRDLARALSQHMLTNTNLAGLLEHVQEVFAIRSGPITLQDVLTTLTMPHWRPADIGPDPWAVVESEVVVNGTRLKLVGTRTYLPGHYDFGPLHSHGEYAEPFEGKLRVVWTDPVAWHQAALNFLEHLEAEDVQLPVVELTEEMARHEEWFEVALATGGVAEYRTGDDELVPAILVGHDCYVVFGYPVEANPGDGSNIELAAVDDNFSHVVMLDEHAVCLEWIAYDLETRRHPGQFNEYFESLRQSLLKGEGLPVTPRDDGQPGLLFVRPATTFDIQQELMVEFTHLADEVAFVLKTSNLALARELLGKVVARDLMVYDRAGRPSYVAQFSVPKSEGLPELSLTFDSESPGMTTMSNLIRSSYGNTREDSVELLVEVAPQLLRLVDSIGKKTMDTALSHGLVLRLPVGFLEELDQPPTRCSQIPSVPDHIVSVLERPLLGDGSLSIRRARYLRDNF
ncbi:hypothetical protein [Pseudomonas sp. SBT1-2]|uniref:hypothetical protein n=1 Tax=Pseudomonas sp. SBT1-2 TaxID=3027852 RepID=UPI00236206D3|nr:hypothetical protein [Pseudomonas sp. SBT1-2]